MGVDGESSVDVFFEEKRPSWLSSTYVFHPNPQKSRSSWILANSEDDATAVVHGDPTGPTGPASWTVAGSVCFRWVFGGFRSGPGCSLSKQTCAKAQREVVPVIPGLPWSMVQILFQVGNRAVLDQSFLRTETA